MFIYVANMPRPLWLYCNICINPKSNCFYITQCQHLLCKDCAVISYQRKSCLFCTKANIQIIRLDKNTPQKVKNYFTLDVGLSTITGIIKFNVQQHDNYLKGLMQRMNQIENEFRRLKHAYKVQHNEMIKLNMTFEKLRIEEQTRARRSTARGGNNSNFTNSFRFGFPSNNNRTSSDRDRLGHMRNKTFFTLPSDARSSGSDVRSSTLPTIHKGIPWRKH